MVDTTEQGRDLVSFLGVVEDHWCADSREQFLQFHSEANGMIAIKHGQGFGAKDSDIPNPF